MQCYHWRGNASGKGLRVLGWSTGRLGQAPKRITLCVCSTFRVLTESGWSYRRLVIGSSGVPGSPEKSRGACPGVPNYSAGDWGSRGANRSEDLVGYLRTASSAESGGGRAVKRRGRA